MWVPPSSLPSPPSTLPIACKTYSFSFLILHKRIHLSLSLSLSHTSETSSPLSVLMEGPNLSLSSRTSENEGDQLELGLGLSLGGGGGGSVKAAAKWGDYGRILTAKDFPNGFSSNCVSGTKRAAADTVSPPTPEVGSPAAATTGVSQVVGWPPIKAYRMNSLVNQAKSPSPEEDKGVGGNDVVKDNSKKKVSHGSKNTNSSGKEIKGHIGFVKVNMDGSVIGRKVDLNSHASYETLAQALEEMFFKSNTTIGPICGEKEKATKPSKLLDGSSDFVLTYEDKDGDWMLVGDVPWGMFLSTVKRLRIMRTSEANGLAPRFQERNERQRSRPI